jgi:hypothetical protein
VYPEVLGIDGEIVIGVLPVLHDPAVEDTALLNTVGVDTNTTSSPMAGVRPSAVGMQITPEFWTMSAT